MLSTIAEIQKGQGLDSGYKWLAGLVSRVCMAGLVFRVCMGGLNISGVQISRDRLVTAGDTSWLWKGHDPTKATATFPPIMIMSTPLQGQVPILWMDLDTDKEDWEPDLNNCTKPSLPHKQSHLYSYIPYLTNWEIKWLSHNQSCLRTPIHDLHLTHKSNTVLSISWYLQVTTSVQN